MHVFDEAERSVRERLQVRQTMKKRRKGEYKRSREMRRSIGHCKIRLNTVHSTVMRGGGRGVEVEGAGTIS
jgi:hypothetical protein